MANFKSLGVKEQQIEVLNKQGIIQPTPIQEKAIPILIEKHDLIGQAQTGTGKTLAFLLPILERVDTSKKEIQALIISPTRELALQITSELNKLTGESSEVGTLAVYGGQDIQGQLNKLKRGVHIVVATPGRLLDHLRRETIDLSTVTMFVLDEADQMLHMGFLPEVETIIQALPDDRQTMLFSATMPNEVKKLARTYMNKPKEVHVKGDNVTLDEVKQMVIETTDREKQDKLMAVLDQFRPFLAVIFCRTKRRAMKLNAALQSNGYLSDELHGDLSQAKREKVMQRFRDMKIQYLVATDVAARGLDVEGVTHVFNYDIPQDVESYIHRIGRTGRAGGEGIAVTFVASKDSQYLKLIERGIKRTIKRKEI
ncbi:DEAD/DEAH box helicase [Aquibacillus koreensis]|uniref:RNA helicase n=1 Tax=Aquibacillus koreensis TaxID=279446 RepID=A0A9X3WLM3_9BACI|nr:DEAD/DEAH box helicase [Aquibacillus koreensis]MCT2538183.1 DEAD/DEAH box helicase [Aquibacillus koreensis]MDC3420873.1 DEAD/DEAH box helicase [Aquibacillus koreensis]